MLATQRGKIGLREKSLWFCGLFALWYCSILVDLNKGKKNKIWGPLYDNLIIYATNYITAPIRYKLYVNILFPNYVISRKIGQSKNLWFIKSTDTVSFILLSNIDYYVREFIGEYRLPRCNLWNLVTNSIIQKYLVIWSWYHVKIRK